MAKGNSEKIDSKRLRTVGRSLKDIRESTGLTQDEFANKMGISRKTCSNYELGKRDPGTLFWLKLSDLTGDIYLRTSKSDGNEQSLTETTTCCGKSMSVLSSLLEKRKHHIASKQAFASETMSPFQQKVFAAAQTVLGGAMMAAMLRICAVRYEFPFGEPIAGIDWSFLTSLILILLVLPSQIRRAVEYWKWSSNSFAA